MCLKEHEINWEVSSLIYHEPKTQYWHSHSYQQKQNGVLYIGYFFLRKKVERNAMFYERNFLKFLQKYLKQCLQNTTKEEF